MNRSTTPTSHWSPPTHTRGIVISELSAHVVPNTIPLAHPCAKGDQEHANHACRCPSETEDVRTANTVHVTCADKHPRRQGCATTRQLQDAASPNTAHVVHAGESISHHQEI